MYIMKKTTVSDFIISYIASLGVKKIFLISGGADVQLIDSIIKNGSVEYVCNHNEQASAMAAESYARVTENIGVCIVTVGPGATNTITGVAGAWLDSIPTLYISGQVKRDNMVGNANLRQLGVQEINIIDLVKPITKYAVIVTDPSEIKYHIKKAVFLAKSGRPGPVYLDIPSDVQTSLVEVETLKDFSPEEEGGLQFKNNKLIDQVNRTIEYLKKAKRPVIFAGHGINLGKARTEFMELVEKLKIPVVTTMSANDIIPTDHFLFSGKPGVFGNRSGNFVIQNADLVISIGARHHLWNIGYNYVSFAKNAIKIVVDIDETELKKKTVVPDLPIQADAKAFINGIIDRSNDTVFPDVSHWLRQCQEWKRKYPVLLPEYKKEKKYVNSYYFTDTLSSMLKERDVIVTGVGTSFTGSLQSFRIKKGQRYHCNVGCASMGYDLPAAIGASFANDGKRIILLTGDGSIMFNLQELQTIVHHNLNIKIFLLNNSGYLAIKNTQNSFFGGRLAAVDKKTGVSFPNFKKIAGAFEMKYEKIRNHTEMSKKIRKVLSYKNGPVLCEIQMSPTQPLYPKVYSAKNPDGTMVSKPLEDMYPFLERDEFAKNMGAVSLLK